MTLGGYDPPLDREPALVQQNVLHSYISPRREKETSSAGAQRSTGNRRYAYIHDRFCYYTNAEGKGQIIRLLFLRCTSRL